MTTLTDSSIEIPDFTDPATYVAGIPHDAFDGLRTLGLTALNEEIGVHDVSHALPLFGGNSGVVSRLRAKRQAVSV